MSRFNYSAATPIGQLISEAINSFQEGHYKIKRASDAVTLMSDEQIFNELNVDSSSQVEFCNALNQLKTAIEAEPFNALLPNLDQG